VGSGPIPRLCDLMTDDGEAADRVVVLCTGNAARSVMAGAMLEAAGTPVRVVTAGTHVVEHQPMSVRTRAALTGVGIDVAHHRSRQLTEDHVEEAVLIVAMAAEHVLYVRRRHPAAADRTATIAWLARNLPPPPPALAERVAGLHLEQVTPEDQGDVDDPAGGTDEDYERCAGELSALVAALVPRLG
jgi:protein-tyrosine phosphatase